MADYGFRISYDGYDVKTCDDKNCVVTSKYSNLKGSISGGGTATTQNGSDTTVTIAHNLGYIPMARVIITFDSDWYFNTPYIWATASVDENVNHWTDSTNLYIYYYYWFYAEDEGIDVSINYKYFIFLDKAKV